MDSQKQEHITDIFRNGWVGEKTGDSITLKVPGSGVALQYRKSVRHSACPAYAVVDGEESAPVFLGCYPQEGLEKYREYLPEITEEDMKLISQPLDFMGQNIYNGYRICRGADGKGEYADRPIGEEKTAAGWPVTPGCLYWGVRFLYERYRLPVYITENGMSCHDTVSADGRVHDPDRIAFLDRCPGALQCAADEGADVRGYFLWTFLDNFEWDKGYTERFGAVYVDFLSQRRIVKDSAYWYKNIIESNGKELSMNQTTKTILFLQPEFKQMIWGGSRLKTDWNYDIPGDNTGECWAISAHPNGDCTVSHGPFAGKKLSWLWAEHPELFSNADKGSKPGKGSETGKEKFPLLVKIIDAREDLSIQVHPDDAYAMEHENGSFGKTECWYILDCQPGASLVIGHNAASREEMKEMIENGRWQEFLREVPVQKGDFIQIDPGTVHAIKGGIMLLETQQNSDITYRVYDYDRLSDGKPRELHIEKSLEVIQAPAIPSEKCIFHPEEGRVNEPQLLMENEYYRIFRGKVEGSMKLTQSYDFLQFSILEGCGTADGTAVKKGDHFILPYGYGEVLLEGSMEVMFSAPGRTEE